ncbi:head decoration protein [Rhizobium sp. CFBP 8762]|uniref:head decoration protein n=1 Tax=Rhizobium sp. CFBP 8762 TaxID=2775279 RepID=UPI00177B4C8D|nr:head decoration protein [Rhizobium sp. CFBP 8762]MBD8556900.1 head decoration protein [Rhizobium sp. CFBP 8762]
MKTVHETARPLAFLLTEANGYISREVLTIAAGSGKLEAGTVLGKVTATSKHIPSPAALVAGSEGAETANAVLGYGVDATTVDVEVVCITNDAEVKRPMLIFHPSVNDAGKTNAKLNQLRSVTIKAR